MQTANSLRRLPSSYIREILSAATSPGCISLAGGLPNEVLFPFEMLSETFAELAAQPQHYTHLYQYGLTSGYSPLVDKLKQQYAVEDTAALMITSGSQQGIDLAARTFLNPGDGVLMEAPSYLGAIQTFSLAGAELVTVAQHRDGPSLTQIEEAFKTRKFKLFYGVPDFHNPSGRCWSLAVRKGVAELCRRYKVLFIEDAPYRELRFNGAAMPMVAEFCPDNSLVLRSFSKIAVPGLRLGSLVGPQALVAPLIRVKQAMDLHTNLPAQHLLLKLLTHSAYPQHLQRLRRTYRQRSGIMCQQLDKHFSEFGEYQPVDGGMFIWLELPGIDTNAMAKKALGQGVAVVPSAVFYPASNKNNHALRLNFSHPSEENIRQGVARLRQCLTCY